jgi:hypothetical protein
VDDPAAAAARENAAWCQLVCAAHGIDGRTVGSWWITDAPPPPSYPDAVSLTRHAAFDDVRDRLADRPALSIKDSFASLDLVPFGGRVLFEADWLVLEPSRAAVGDGVDPSAWHWVDSASELAAWEAGWRSADDGAVVRPEPMFPPSLLHAAAVVGARPSAGRVTAGAIVHPSDDDGVVGISNVFGGPATAVWSGVVALAASRFADRPLVGYESGDDAMAPRGLGFEPVGRLRVWTWSSG